MPDNFISQHLLPKYATALYCDELVYYFLMIIMADKVYVL